MTVPTEPTDQERQATVARLSAAVEAGHLTLDEFSERTASAYAARTSADLAPLVAGLPAPPAESAPVTPEHTPVGAIKRGGRWRLPPRTLISTAIGPIKLDFSQAELASSEAVVVASASIGTVKVWVPAGWRVEVSGRTGVGGRRVEENHLPPAVAAPTLRLRLDTGIGTVKVFRV